jgi:hypothetical protein
MNQRWTGKTEGVLVVVPCGRAKIWIKCPAAGPVIAKDAYVGAPFKVNRAFAETFGSRWVILSAKYGFIWPEFEIPEPYEVTFKGKGLGCVSSEMLKFQVAKLGLDRYSRVIGLGGRDYRLRIEAAFSDLPVELNFPFAGLPVGKAMQAANREIAMRKS